MGKIILALFFAVLFFSHSLEAAEITDMLGRKVNVPDKVNRIIPLGSSMSFISFLRAQDKVIGVEKIDRMTFEKRSYLYANKDITANLPVIAEGGATKRPNIEGIITLKPDVIFTITTDIAEADLLQRMTRIPVIVLSYGYTGVNFHDINESLRIAGRILGKKERAEELISYIDKLRKELYYHPEKKKTAYIGSLSYKGNQGINSTETGFLPFQLAGVENVADRIGRKGHLFIDKEFAAMMNAELIFVDSAGYSITAQDAIKETAYFKRMKAFEKGNAYMILANTYYFVNIDFMLANAFFIAKTAYPDKYADLDIRAKTDEIIEQFSGQKLFNIVEADSGGFKRIKPVSKGFVLEGLD